MSHSCDVTPYQTVFFMIHSNFASSLTQMHCLLPQCYCCWWNWQNTEKNIQCSSLSLYRQTVYSGKYSGHCVVLVLLTEWLLLIVQQYIWFYVDKLLVASVSNWLTDRLHGADSLRSRCFFYSSRNSPKFSKQNVHYRAHNTPSVDNSARPVQSVSLLHSVSWK